MRSRKYDDDDNRCKICGSYVAPVDGVLHAEIVGGLFSCYPCLASGLSGDDIGEDDVHAKTIAALTCPEGGYCAHAQGVCDCLGFEKGSYGCLLIR